MIKNEDCVKVAIRCRPLSNKEKTEEKEEIVTVEDARKEIILKATDELQKPVKFTYDFTFGQNINQETIYNECAKPVIDFLLEGFNCTIFAYGQTGTGKTFTMDGAKGGPELIGIIPRTFNQIFDKINNAGENQEYLVRASMLELYNEELKDSLLPDGNKRLEIHEDPKTGFYVKDLSCVTVKNPKELMEKLNYGKSNRHVRATEMNDYSSRSHSIFNIIIESSERDQTGNQFFRCGKLNLVDLAGSEKQKKTKTTDDALKEGININLSLTTLGNVINLLVKKAPHIPFRNSKLTKLLADSLGGNSKTLMIANIGPASSNYLETLQTLKYANRAKQIQNKPVVNEDAKDAQLKQKQDELKLLKLQIEQLGLHKTELIKNLDSINSTVRQIENSGKKKRGNDQKENQEDEMLKKLEHEGMDIQNEKKLLEEKLQETQNKLKNEENEKNALLAKYNSMCKDIISKHDYEQDLNVAREELDKLNKDKSKQKQYIETKKLLQEKKQQVDHIDAKSKQIQDRLDNVNQQLQNYREQIAAMKANKQTTGQNIKGRIESMTEMVSENRLKIKKQVFFLHNLVPEKFRQHIIDLDSGEISSQGIIKPYAMNSLKRPISCMHYSLKCSYKNPYIKQIHAKKKKMEYPELAEIYDDGKINRC